MVSKCLFVMLIVLGLMIPAQANLLVNGDFNTGALSPWWTWAPGADQSVAIDTVYTYDNTPNVKIISGGTGTAVRAGYDLTGLTPGATYTLSLVYSARDAGGLGGAGININYRDSDWNYLDYKWWGLYWGAAPNPGQWSTFTDTFTMPANATIASILLMADTYAVVNIDNVAVTPEPATMLLLGFGWLALRRIRA